ncbi:MAG: TatD family deoxyribonuclease [Gammaproteobacteria bacterium]|nr:TatD family deoxyribonuclease [Gammaproteobacteria bacterium]
MLIDSHCHLNMLDLTDFDQDLQKVIAQARANDVSRMLTVCVTLEDLPKIEAIAEQFSEVYTSVGVHPNEQTSDEPDTNDLVRLAAYPACIAIGETGLDYFRIESEAEQAFQQQRFRNHIRAALISQKPLIIHTRQASVDTIRIMQEENAQDIGGVMHCFTEDWTVAQQALDLNFYISFSGILTFKSAVDLQEIAKKVPVDRMLIETDSPYLAPVPFRGKQNHPALVKQVAMALAALRGMTYAEIATVTTANFDRCFRVTPT